MSEHINVDYAFDPEARQAQADFDAYLDSQPYKNDKGKARHPLTDKPINYDKYMDDRRTAHEHDSSAESDYSNESLTQLAERVARARSEGDRTTANDAEEVFFARFTADAEKYGWEDDDSADETASVNHPDVRDQPAGRKTIDDRLARYGKIMYGDDEVETDAPSVDGGVEDEPTNVAQTEANNDFTNTVQDITPKSEELQVNYEAIKEEEPVEPHVEVTTQSVDETVDGDVFGRPAGKRRADVPAEIVPDGFVARKDIGRHKLETDDDLSEYAKLSQEMFGEPTEAAEGESLEEYEQRHSQGDHRHASVEGDTFHAPSSDDEAVLPAPRSTARLDAILDSVSAEGEMPSPRSTTRLDGVLSDAEGSSAPRALPTHRLDALLSSADTPSRPHRLGTSRLDSIINAEPAAPQPSGETPTLWQRTSERLKQRRNSRTILALAPAFVFFDLVESTVLPILRAIFAASSK
jgi:hypothetical protein